MSGSISRLAAGAAAVLLTTSSVMAADAPLTLQQKQDMRFPQPVRVGSLVGEEVVQRGVTHKRLGIVVGVFKDSDGDLSLVFRYGATLGFGGRIIAPPLEEVSLVGPMVKINELDGKDLAALPTFNPAGGALLAANDVIHIGVDRKY